MSDPIHDLKQATDKAYQKALSALGWPYDPQANSVLTLPGVVLELTERVRSLEQNNKIYTGLIEMIRLYKDDPATLQKWSATCFKIPWLDSLIQEAALLREEVAKLREALEITEGERSQLVTD